MEGFVGVEMLLLTNLSHLRDKSLFRSIIFATSLANRAAPSLRDLVSQWWRETGCRLNVVLRGLPLPANIRDLWLINRVLLPSIACEGFLVSAELAPPSKSTLDRSVIIDVDRAVAI